MLRRPHLDSAVAVLLDADAPELEEVAARGPDRPFEHAVDHLAA